jgi:plastocyanin
MKNPNLILLIVMLVSSISLSGCVDQSQPTAKTIEINDFSFQPDSITVPIGTTVTWINHDPSSHTITSDNGKFDSGITKSGGEFQFAFSQPGTYKYHCKIHPSMTGMVTVTSAQPSKTPSALAESNTTKSNTTSMPMVALTQQDWPNVNYDSSMSRHSPQTTISKDNVNQLQVKWILNTGHTI